MPIRAIAVNLCFTVFLPLIAVNVLTARGVGVVPALAVSAIFPFAETTAGWIRSRHLDPLGTISLTFIVLGVGAALLSGDAHFALAKESGFTAIFGLLCLGSLVTARPLMFYIARTFNAGADPVRIDAWNGNWTFPYFREVMRRLTIVWGVVYLCEAALRIVLVYVLPVKVTITVSPLLALATTVALIAWTLRYGERAKQHSAALRAERERTAAAR